METQHFSSPLDFPPHPHSLGILIEWKLELNVKLKVGSGSNHPHSLGILIEWKR